MTRHLASPGRLTILVAVAGGLLLAGCAGGTDATDVTAGAGLSVDSQLPAGAAPAEAGLDGKDAGPPGAVTTADGADAPAVVVVGDLAVAVDDVLGAVSDVTGLVTTYSGQVDGQSTQTGGTTGPEDDTATLVVRVAPARVDAFAADAAALGTLLSADVSRTDVSAEVADVSVRTQNARASVARVRALLTEARQLSDVVLLEAEMSRRQADLEALEARSRVLADQTALASLTVRLSGAAAAPVPVAASTGFLAGLASGWAAFSAAAVGALTVLGALTPFLLLALLVAGTVLLTVRVSRRRREEPAPPQAAHG